MSDKVTINATKIGLEGVTLYLDIKKPIQKPFVRFEANIDSGDGRIDLNYLNTTIDVCRFYRDRKYFPFVQTLYRTFIKQGNYPTSCPIKKVNPDLVIAMRV